VAIAKVLGLETEYGIIIKGSADPNPITASSALINAYVSELSRRSRPKLIMKKNSQMLMQRWRLTEILLASPATGGDRLRGSGTQMAFLGAFKDFAQKHLQLEKDDVQLQREKEQSAAAGEFGPLFDRLADDDAPAPEAPSASASAPTSWLGLGNLLDLSALHPGGGGYEDDADEPPQVRGLKGKVRALEARATEQRR